MKAYEIQSQVLKAMAGMAAVGVAVADIDKMAEEMIIGLGGKPYNKGYHPIYAATPYPAATCISVNNCIAHGIPNTYVLRSGDIVNFDTSVIKDGQCADAALSIGIGEVSNKNKNLLKYAKRVLYEGISVIKDGVSTEKLAEAIHTAAIRYGYKINRRFIGHGIGSEMHMPPKIYHFMQTHAEQLSSTPRQPEYLHENQIICIEPILTYSKDDMGVFDKEGWACYTTDGKPCAMFEHMVRITKTGCEILTDHIDDSDDIIIKI
ncbi:MAG: Methionine aminopeptidase 1 [Candidatus Omnitrophica bacterium]|nr:Methionine aminopeptidase 1 [Ignavibacteriaceae bacterium]MCG3176849.1 Methionine aminopeptidase 1 [Candidatus Omnitrophota bacterium]